MNQKVLIFGSTGQLGLAFQHLLNQKEVLFIALDEKEGDFTDLQKVESLLAHHQPSIVLNSAAYTAVDLAEEKRDLALQINATGPGRIARWCAQHDTPLVHFSTDYVYPGFGTQPWKEEDSTAPLNWYGETKLRGDLEVQAAGGRHLIFRTSWVYDADGKNFPNTMLRLGREKKILKIVSDQIGAPTFAGHLADFAWRGLENAWRAKAFPSGVYHLCNQGETSWHSFALEVFKIARERGYSLTLENVEPIETKDYSTPARRPLNSRLSLKKLETGLGITPPDWREGLRECAKDWKL